MVNRVNASDRKAWSAPKLKYLDAGSAEANPTGTRNDSGAGGSNKS